MAVKKSQSDFAGWATKYNVLCTDGRTIRSDAFKHMDGKKVPMLYQHGHNDLNNVLGYAVLEHRAEGVYAYGFFNDTEAGTAAKKAVAHKDIEALSIYANKLLQRDNLVHSGTIREMSLVLAGANPGAFIENVSIVHADESESIVDDAAIIYSGIPLDEIEHKYTNEETEEHVKEKKDVEPRTEEGDQTVGEILDEMPEKYKTVLYALLSQALGEGDDIQQSDNEGDNFMKKNLFENEGEGLTHDQLSEFAGKVFADAQKGGSFKDAFLAHAGTYGIDNMSYLFPDAQELDDPTFDTRRMGWVPGWMSGTRHVPFSRIKKVWADLTPDAARAKGYITGNEKVEQVFALLKRTTEPTTIYKKQKLDRDDIVDVSKFDVVAWMWREMRFMLEEEVARAALVGDGRTFGTDDDAIDPSKIRPIYGDAALFVHYLTLQVTDTDWLDIIDAIQLARVNYKGTGTPTLYTTNAVLTGMLLVRDTTDRRIYKSIQELSADLRVADIVEVEVLEGVERDTDGQGTMADLLGIMVNPRDYTYGADKGGAIATFDDFDIDFNQYKYLIETRISGSLLNPKSALCIERLQELEGS